MQRPGGEAIGTWISLGILAVLMGLYYVYLTTGTLGFALGLVAAVDTGFLVSLMTFVLQSPNFRVRLAKDEWDGKSPFFFVHVIVTNNSIGFLGGGIAERCKGEISVDGAGSFTPKWATRAEPIQRSFIPVQGSVQLLQTVDPALMDEAKFETLLPGDEKVLDIGVKVKDDANFYIHEPENYYDPLHKRNPVTPGKHVVSLTLKHGSRRAGPFNFNLEVKEDTTRADSLTIVPG